MSSIDCNAGRLERTSTPNLQAFTVCWWQRHDSATPGDSLASFAMVSNDQLTYIGIVTTGNSSYYYFSDGGTLVVACDTNWRFFAMTRESEGGGTYVTRLYWATRGAAFSTASFTGQASVGVALNSYFGGSGFGDVFPGQIRNAKVWDGVALSSAALSAEMYSTRPHRYGGLWFWNPLIVVASAGTDLSGAGHAFSTSGSLSLSDRDPGVPLELAA